MIRNAISEKIGCAASGALLALAKFRWASCRWCRRCGLLEIAPVNVAPVNDSLRLPIVAYSSAHPFGEVLPCRIW